MKKSSRKRQFEDAEQATSSEKSMKRSYESDSEEFNSESLVETANNQSIKGFLAQDKKKSKYEYDYKKEKQFISLVEHVDWIYNSYGEMIQHLDYPEPTTEPLNLEAQYDFVDKEIYDDIRHCKSALDQFSKDILRTAKSSSNPFELINKLFFQNRSALKMANLDYLTDYMFTSPKSLIDESKDILLFCDICGGPGKFVCLFFIHLLMMITCAIYLLKFLDHF